jgi:hypothetical protein
MNMKELVDVIAWVEERKARGMSTRAIQIEGRQRGLTPYKIATCIKIINKRWADTFAADKKTLAEDARAYYLRLADAAESMGKINEAITARREADKIAGLYNETPDGVDGAVGMITKGILEIVKRG